MNQAYPSTATVSDAEGNDAGKPEGYYDCERSEMLAFIPDSVRTVLDIGCGAGTFGRLLKEIRQAEIWGVEANRTIAERAAEYLDNVVTGVFPGGVALPKGYFDCVVFNDVLEHMVDPWRALEESRCLLTGHGIAVASLPNVRYLPVLYRLLARGDWTYTPTGVLDRTHLRFFTKKSMLRLFSETGYEVLRIEGVNPYKHWAVRPLQLIAPGFIRDAKFINYAVVARPATVPGAGA